MEHFKYLHNVFNSMKEGRTLPGFTGQNSLGGTQKIHYVVLRRYGGLSRALTPNIQSQLRQSVTTQKCSAVDDHDPTSWPGHPYACRLNKPNGTCLGYEQIGRVKTWLPEGCEPTASGPDIQPPGQ